MARNIKFGNKNMEIALERYEKHVIGKIKSIVAETAGILKSQATLLAPVDEGNLKQSIEMQFLKGGLTAIVTVGAEYAV